MTTTDWTEPLLAALDAAAADPGYGHRRFGDIIEELSANLTACLAHERGRRASPDRRLPDPCPVAALRPCPR